MSLLRRPLRAFILLLAGFLPAEAAVLGQCPSSTESRTPVGAFATARVEPPSRAAAPATLFGALHAQIIGNRSRMIQMAFIGFAIGIAILVTSTRKH